MRHVSRLIPRLGWIIALGIGVILPLLVSDFDLLDLSRVLTLAMGGVLLADGSLSSVLEYATGVANSQNCEMNGTTYRTSRYSTFNAESHRPTASAVTKANSRNSGSHTMLEVGTMP